MFTMIFFNVYRDYLAVTSMFAAVQVALSLSGMIVLSQICHMVFSEQRLSVFLVDRGYDAVVLLCGTIIIMV